MINRMYSCLLKDFIVYVLFLFFVMLIAGCGSADSRVIFHQEQIPKPEVKVVFAPGDEIEIKFFYVPELNEIQKVRPDGKITLQLVGDVTVQGKTPLELQNELMSRYESELQKPEIAVIVRSLSNQRVYVGGEVNVPGAIDLSRGSLTVLEAIIKAGGFNMESADVENVLVLHQETDHHNKKLITYNLKEAYEGKKNVPIIHLQPLDIVYVPRSTVHKLNMWIEQHINRMIPFGTTITTTRGRTTLGIEPPGTGDSGR